MRLLTRIWRDPWVVIADDRVQIIMGCYFTMSSAPREMASESYVVGAIFLVGGIALIVRAWRRMEDRGAA